MKSQKNETSELYNKENKDKNINLKKDSSPQIYTNKTNNIKLRKSQQNLSINRLTLVPVEEKIITENEKEEKKSTEKTQKSANLKQNII
jgi:hypothetical protein